MTGAPPDRRVGGRPRRRWSTTEGAATRLPTGAPTTCHASEPRGLSLADGLAWRAASCYLCGADGPLNNHRACSGEIGMPGILRTIARVANRHERHPPGSRPRPARIVLDVRDGVTGSAKPPVRMFVGTEPAQYRAERVFVWSVEQARDPSRVYEIYLMADLAGFDRRRWLTGFTNYRFAIPHFAGGSGRAIYNDVDQIYLRDPAELFDMDMGDAGFLSITARDTSVMLIDCAR